jgi:hypothetical protein
MTTGLANISWSACRKLPVRFPKRKEEQIRIAEGSRLRTKNSLVEQGTAVGLRTARLGLRSVTATPFRLTQLGNMSN